MKHPAAFISYARRDDAAYGGRITGLRQRLQRMVAAAIGRDFEIFQDCEGIAWGEHWRSRLDEALDEALFLIPILTPSYFNSEACRAELETFLELERRSGRKDRILSLYFLDAPVYEQKADPLAAILSERQHRDWRNLRIDPVGSAKVMRALDRLARELAAAIHARQAGVSPPPRVLDTLAQTALPETRTTVPQGREPTASAPTSGRTRNGTSRKPGELFRDVEAPWCPELVVIPAGSFVMGSPQNEEGRHPDEGPQHRVTFATPFALGKYPVTFEEYDHFCAETGQETPPDEGWGRGRRPAINVAWKDAKAYVEWLSKQTGEQYRLPSEAEWEYAARAGSETAYCWGDEAPTPEQANFGFNVGKTTEVGSYPANPWRLHDMHGNVWEWCEDCWNDSYKGAPTDGSPWLKRDCYRRVVRGGSWATSELRFRRSASRFKYTPGIRYSWLGFRVARKLTAQPTTVAAKKTHWSNLRYHDPALAGRVTFDYSNNNGRYSIGRDEFFFETMWSKASDRAIYLLADPDSISGIAEVPGLRSYRDVRDPASYDMSSRVRTIQEGEYAILKNRHNNYAVLKVLDVKDRTRSDSVDELTFEFWILTNAA